MALFILLMIAVSLSMDAFSLALAYGTLSLPKNHIIKLSLIVGIFHFIMPLIGLLFGKAFFSLVNINPNLVVFLILIIIGIEMVVESFKTKDTQSLMGLIQLLLFGLAVSVDSFSLGIGLNEFGISPFINALTFSIFSFLFTYLGLILGKKINNIIGKTSTLLGGITLIIIAIIYLIK